MKKRLLLLMMCATGLTAVAQQPPISHVETNNVRATILGNGSVLSCGSVKISILILDILISSFEDIITFNIDYNAMEAIFY